MKKSRRNVPADRCRRCRGQLPPVQAAAEVKRHPLPGSDFPIAQAVEILPGTTLVYHSGMTPGPANPDAERYSTEFWGDTEAQTLSCIRAPRRVAESQGPQLRPCGEDADLSGRRT